jgi:hypothetical protein
MGWVEAFPMTNKKASTVTMILVTDIIPRFGLPAYIQSDNGPEFVSSISQKLAQALNIHMKYSCEYFTFPITPNLQVELSVPIAH